MALVGDGRRNKTDLDDVDAEIDEKRDSQKRSRAEADDIVT